MALTKEQEILKNMQLLKISREEAEQLWIDDHSDEILPEVAEMEKKAKKIKNYVSSAEKHKKKAPKERKIDEEKKRILNDVRVLVEGLQATNVTLKNEAELSFTLNENDYTFKLIKHRKPKN